MTNFEMTQEQMDTIVKACRPVPMLMLQCGEPISRQARANAAWKALGSEMGFDSTTVEPTGKGPLFFRAKSV